VSVSAGICAGRSVVITGAGNGIGRAHALAFAAEGANVVVNDVGAARDGSGGSAGAAQQVADEITATGGQAIANTDDITDWAGGERLVRQATEAFGRLDVLVNNAGILRDRMVVNMTEAEWDSVVAVHLKGTFVTSHHAAAYWRDRAKAGEDNDARIINTTSSSGIFGNVGQANYGAAKAGIASLTIITSMELQRYGVTVNAVAPTAYTRMTEDLPRYQEAAKDPTARESLDPSHISPVVVWLGSALSRSVTGRVFSVRGTRISVCEGWVHGPTIERDEHWTPGELDEVLPDLVAAAAPNAETSGERPSH
jgi:NAD(P)-dependent dehydrogenase (short-subunit alcohol dehydrogenase family)